MNIELSRLTVVTSCSQDERIEHDFAILDTRFISHFTGWHTLDFAVHPFVSAKARFRAIEEAFTQDKNIHLYDPWYGLPPKRQLEGIQRVITALAILEDRRAIIFALDAEATVLRILRCVRDHVLMPDEVVFNVLSYYDDTLQNYALHVDQRGDFDSPWPDGFFDWRGEELFS